MAGHDHDVPRPFRPLRALSDAVDRLAEHADTWSTPRLLDEGLDLARDTGWADAAALVRVRGDLVVPVRRRPTGTVSPVAPVPTHWFPWGLATVQPDRYLMVPDARVLQVRPGGRTLGELGWHSALVLPLHDRDGGGGSLLLHWRSPHLTWDDDRGRLLRTLGRFLLDRTAPDRPITGSTPMVLPAD